MQISLWGDGPVAEAVLAAARSLGWDASTDGEPSDERDVVAVAPLAASVAGCDVAIARHVAGKRAFAWPMVSVPAVQQLIARCGQIGTLTNLSSRTTRSAASRSDDTTASILATVHDQIALLVLLGQVGGLGLPHAVSLRSPASDVDRIGLHYAGDANVVAAAEITWADSSAPTLDVQVAGTGGVLRIETDPSTRLEHNGEPVPLRTPTPVDPSMLVLRDAGVVDMLKTIGAAFAENRPLAHAFSFEFGRSIVVIAETATRSAAASGTPIEIGEQRLR